MGPTEKRPAHVPRSVWWRIPQARRRLWWKWRTTKYNPNLVQYLLERTPHGPRRPRSLKDRDAATERLERALAKNGGKALAVEQRRRIGLPKLSTGI